MTERQIILGWDIVLGSGWPEEKPVIAKKELSELQKKFFPEFSHFHHWMEPGENFAVPIFMNPDNQNGKYLIMIYGPIDKDINPKTIPFRGSIRISASDFSSENNQLTAKGVELPGLTLAIRLVQGEDKSEQVALPLTETMTFDYPEFKFDPQKPLRMKFWISGHIS